MHIYLFFFSNQTRLQVVRTVLPNCLRFDVVPRLLIGAQRSIELQASGVGPFHPSFRHSPTRSVVSFPLYPLLGLVPSTYSFLCFLPFCYALYIYIYISYPLVPSQWLGPRYPNSISVQLQFIPVSKRQFTLRSSLPRVSAESE